MKHFTRDGAILVCALAWGWYELLLAGARPAALTFISGLLLSPVVLRLDDIRKERKNGSKGEP